MSRHHLAVVLFISLCRLTLSRALHVDDADAQVVYNGEGSSAGRALACKLNAVKCASSWWLEHSAEYHNGSLHVSHGPVASASFSFQGSALYLVGSTFPRGAKALVAVDDLAPEVVDFTSRTGLRVNGVRLYARDGLDPAATHVVHVSYDSTSFVSRPDERRYMALDAFVVEDGTDAPPNTPFTSPEYPISYSSGTVLARADDIPTAGSGSSPTFNDLYADSDENDTSSASPSTPTQWSPVPTQHTSFNTGQIAAVSVVGAVLLTALVFAVAWCIRARVCYGPRRVRQSSRRGESILSWSFGSASGQRNGGTPMQQQRPGAINPPRAADARRAPAAPAGTPAVPARSPTTPSRSRAASAARRNIARSSLEAQRSPSPPLETPATPSPISPANSNTPLAVPRRAASSASAGPSSRRLPPASLPLASAGTLHPHAVPAPMGSPRLAEWAQSVVIPTAPPPSAAPPPYTPRSRSGRSPRTLAELREKMSPYTA